MTPPWASVPAYVLGAKSEDPRPLPVGRVCETRKPAPWPRFHSARPRTLLGKAGGAVASGLRRGLAPSTSVPGTLRPGGQLQAMRMGVRVT